MTPDLWILWVFLTLGGGSAPTSQAAAFHTEQACEAAKAKIIEAHNTLDWRRPRMLVCTPNFQVSPK